MGRYLNVAFEVNEIAHLEAADQGHAVVVRCRARDRRRAEIDQEMRPALP